MSIPSQKTKKILLRSPNWIGDAIMSLPVPAAIKGTNPNCEIHILARSWVAPLWEGHPEINRVMRVPDEAGGLFLWHWFKAIRKLRSEQYDLGIILPNSFSSAWFMFWTGCRKRVGYATDHRGFLLTHKVAWSNSLYHWPRPKVYLNLARKAGADVDLCQTWTFTVKVSAKELERADELLQLSGKKQVVGLAPGSVASSRRWPAERFAQTADRLDAQGYRVVLIGSPMDSEIAEQVARKCKYKPRILAGRTNLREGLAVIRRLDLLISNDSGAMHMAYAQGVPVIVLQGAADPKVTGPFGKNSQTIRDETLKCVPCVKNECPKKHLKCMRNISVDEVWNKVQDILNPRK
jgi:heptosyltransferase-2